VEKVYRAVLDQQIYNQQLNDLRRGVVIDGYQTRSAGVYVKTNQPGNVVLKIVISEGKKRQVRLMVEAVGRKVLNLKRMQIGEIELGKLPTGMWRLCSTQEVNYLRGLMRKRLEKSTLPKNKDRK
jgi:23S rRNA pseudouridine2605 synthase